MVFSLVLVFPNAPSHQRGLDFNVGEGFSSGVSTWEKRGMGGEKKKG